MEVFPDLTDDMKGKDPFGIGSLSLFNHSDVIANAFHFLALLFNQLPFVNVDYIHFTPLQLDISFLLLGDHDLLLQLHLLVIVVNCSEVAGALLYVLAHEVKLRATHHLLVQEHLLKLIHWFFVLLRM